MTTTQIIAAIAIVMVALIALAARRTGPRVTHIETRRTDSDEAEK